MAAPNLDRDVENQVLQKVSPASARGLTRVITVGDIFNLLSAGMSTRSIRRQRPEIKPETVALARAFIIANDPESYDAISLKKKEKNYKTLVDECIDHKVLAAIHSNFGNTTHTRFEALNGCGTSRADGDKPLWQWAVNNNIDAIITRDWNMNNDETDLTKIAVNESMCIMEELEHKNPDAIDFDELPLVVHVKTQSGGYRKISRLLHMHKDGIISYLETRTSPYIEVTEHGVRSGPTYIELWAAQTKDVNKMKARKDMWIEKWAKRIFSDKKPEKLSDQHKENIMNMLKASAVQAEELRDITEHGKAIVRRPEAYLP